MKSIRMGSLVVGVLLATSAFARMPLTETPPPEATVPVTAIAGSASLSSAGAASDSSSESAARSASNSTSESASHLDGELLNEQEQEQRQITSNVNQVTNLSIGRGLIIPVDCGAGFDTGGANKSGAAFLGITWTTKTCYQLKSAIGFTAMGEYATSCEILAYIARDALKARNKQVDCEVIANRIISRQNLMIETDKAGRQGYLVPPDVVTRAEFRETIERVFKATQKK